MAIVQDCENTAKTLQAEKSQGSGSPSALTYHVRGISKAAVSVYCSYNCAPLTSLTTGVPFFPENQFPKAPCPCCSAEKQDKSNKKLFFIDGTAKGQYDPHIPDEFFTILPSALEGSEHAQQALRVRGRQAVDDHRIY